MAFERKLTYKVYSEAGTYLGVLDDVISDLRITKQINGGDSEFKISLARKFDDFDEDVTIKFNNRIKVYLKDDYNAAGTTLVANGYIVSYAPFLKGKEEGIEVTCLSAVSKLSNDFYRTGNSADASELGVELATQRADQMMEAIITHYRSIEANSMLSADFSNSDSTTDNAGGAITFTHRFFNMKHLDALREASKFLPKNKEGGYWFYWRIETDGTLWVKNLSATADHSFIIGKHIKEITGNKTIEDLVNRIYFWNEKGTVDPDYIKLVDDDSTSQSSYDIISDYITDSKITNTTAATLLATSKLYDHKDPKVQIKITLTGDYDLASIKPGQTCTLLNAKENPYKIGSDNVLLIESVEYTPDEVILELSNGHVSFEDIVEEERQRLDKELTWFGYITQQLTAAQLAPADRTWVTNITFAAATGADAYRKVDWSAGKVYIPSGAAGEAAIREIAAGTTGNMLAATPYVIYLDEEAKPTDTATESGTSGVVEEGGQYLTDLSKSWTVNEWAGYVVSINSEKQIIKSNTATTLTVEEFFLDDFTGVYDISKLLFSVTSTASDATAVSRIIFSNVQANANTDSQATITPVGTGASTNLDGATQIAEYSIPDGRIIDLTVAKLTSGTISSKQITLSVADGTGDTYIAAGKTAFNNTETGFILGIDDSDANKAKFYIGNTTRYLNWDGTSLSIAGNISAGSIDIGGSDATSFHVDEDGNLWLGAATFNSASFSVTNAGVIYATSGTIGGSALGTDYIQSAAFLSGPLGYGWNIGSNGYAEFQNITVRGEIRTAVFQKDTISSVNGMFLISKADVLAVAMTAADSSTLEINGETTFVNNEVLRMKDGVDDEWLLVTDASGAPEYVVTRDLAAAYSTNSNPAWTAGNTVVSMGVGTGTKTGFILLDATSNNSPYIDIYGRNSNTYSDYTLHGRYGWLKGIVDADVGLNNSDEWGLYSDNAYIKGAIAGLTGYFGDTTNGVSIASNGLLINGTGYIRTGASGERIELVQTGTFGHEINMYNSSDVETVTWYANTGQLLITPGDRAIFINATSTSATSSLIEINSTGLGHGFEWAGPTSGSNTSARQSYAAFYYNNDVVNHGEGLRLRNATSGWDGKFIHVLPGSFKEPVLEIDSPSSDLKSSRIEASGFLNFPAYHHRSDFDEANNAWASTVLAQAYWTFAGTAGVTAEVAQGYLSNDTWTYARLSTTSTASRNVSIDFKTQTKMSSTMMECMVYFNAITNMKAEWGYYYDATHYLLFRFNSDVDASKIYFAWNNGSGDTATDTGATIAATTWYRFRIRVGPASDVTAWVDDTSVAVGTPSVFDTGSPNFYIDNRSASNERIMYIDYVDFWGGRRTG